MINKNSKTAFQIILGAIMLVSVATIGCNNDASSSTATKVDTAATEKMQEAAPATVVPDSTTKMDTAATRPIVPGNKPTNP